MHELDADQHGIYSKKLKKKADRDITNFVEFLKFECDEKALAKAILAEVPK